MSDGSASPPVLDRAALLRLAARAGLRLDPDDDAALDALAGELTATLSWAAGLPPLPEGATVPDLRDALPDRRRPDAPDAPDAAAAVAAALRADLPSADDDGRALTGPTRQED